MLETRDKIFFIFPPPDRKERLGHGYLSAYVSWKNYFGVGALDALGDEANRLAVKRTLIITDAGVYQAGLADQVKEQLSGVRLSVDVCAEAEPEPTFTRLNTLAEKFRSSKYDLMIGVGGGSSLDTAKALSILL
ncbi:MAG TPA: iron-containing alcohol dehydrogenase, partial [Dehalococcoidales bacterium]|nr:iron-containing alcohol dehydrogenase [Dehalococcoidales bacterium]